MRASAQVIAALQGDIARAVAGNVSDVMDGEWGDREWVHVFVDFELADDGERSSSVTFALARHPGGPLEKIAFRLPQTAKRLFADLAAAMVQDSDGRRWSSARLKIERDGRFIFDFSHDPPYRLGGNLNDTRFNDYLTDWQAGSSQAPPPARHRSWMRV